MKDEDRARGQEVDVRMSDLHEVNFTSLPFAQAEIDRLRAQVAELVEETKWVRRKLGLDESAKTTEVYGEMHVVCDHSDSYVTYIDAYKCDDKQGEIARLTHQLTKARAEEREACIKVATDLAEEYRKEIPKVGRMGARYSWAAAACDKIADAIERRGHERNRKKQEGKGTAKV